MDVDLGGYFLFFIANVFERIESRLVRGVVHENIDATQFLHRRLDDFSAVFRRLHIA